jgi:hypothetical protein
MNIGNIITLGFQLITVNPAPIVDNAVIYEAPPAQTEMVTPKPGAIGSTICTVGVDCG